MNAHIAKKDFYTLPNILTYIRLLCVPAFIATFFAIDGSMGLNVYVSLAIFAFASITDVLDGYIARKYAVTSDLGKMLDPLADKLLQVSAAVCLCVNGFVAHSPFGALRWPFPVLLGVKELFMLVWGIILAKRKLVVHSNVYGKTAALINAVGLLMSFFAKAEYDAYRIACTAVLACGCLLSYIALVNYIVKLSKQLDGTLKNKKDMDLKF